MNSIQLGCSQDYSSHGGPSVVDDGFNTQNFTSDDEECQPVAHQTYSEDEGSVWTVPTVIRPPKQSFQCIFRSDEEVEKLLSSIKAAKPGLTEQVHEVPEPDPRLIDTTNLIAKQENESIDRMDSEVDIDSDSGGSLESLSSEEDNDSEHDSPNENLLPTETVGQKRKQATKLTKNPFSTFGNHALLQYHFKGLPLPASALAVNTSQSNQPKPRAPYKIKQKTNNSMPKRGRHSLSLSTPEERDAYILERVSRWKSTGKEANGGWYNLARVVNMPLNLVRQRWSTLNENKNGTLEDPTVVGVGLDPPSTPNVPPVQSSVHTTEHVSLRQAPKREVIDLTNEPETELTLDSATSRDYSASGDADAELVSYIIACVHDQVCHKDGLQPLWRQLGVELGIRVEVLDQRWWQQLRYAYIRKYGYEQTGTKNEWLCGRVHAWNGRGRGLWEGLGGALGCSAAQVMRYWAFLTPVKMQLHQVEAACNHMIQRRMHREQGRIDSAGGTRLSQAQGHIHRIGLHVYAYYTDTTITLSVEQFWNSVSDRLRLKPHTLLNHWEQACAKACHSDLCLPVIPVQGVRAFTPVHDSKLSLFVHAMRLRWGKTDWTVIAHALSACEDMLRVRWYCFIRPNEFRLYKYCLQLTNGDCAINVVGTVSTSGTKLPCSNTTSSIADPEVTSLVFDMVNTVSITAQLDATTVGTLHHNIRAAWASNKIIPTTIKISHRASLGDADVATVVAAVTSWNAGTSAATTIAQLWGSVSLQLKRAWPPEGLSAYWEKLCQANPHSLLITRPVRNPITASYLVSTFSKLISVYHSKHHLLRFLENTPEAQERWCQFLSHQSRKVYNVLHIQREASASRPSMYSHILGDCVSDMVSAIQLTDCIDAHLAPSSAASVLHGQLRVNKLTRSVVEVVLRKIVSAVVQVTFPRSAKVLQICNAYKKSTHSMVLYKQPLLSVQPLQHSDARKVLLLCIQHARKTHQEVNWTLLACLLRTSKAALRVVWDDVISRLRSEKKRFKTMGEQLDLL